MVTAPVTQLGQHVAVQHEKNCKQIYGKREMFVAVQQLSESKVIVCGSACKPTLANTGYRCDPGLQLSPDLTSTSAPGIQRHWLTLQGCYAGQTTEMLDLKQYRVRRFEFEPRISYAIIGD